jgi:hypothetical protein
MVNDNDLLFGFSFEEASYLCARIQQLENDVAKDKKSLEHAATREGTLKKKLRQPELKREIDSC